MCVCVCACACACVFSLPFRGKEFPCYLPLNGLHHMVLEVVVMSFVYVYSVEVARLLCYVSSNIVKDIVEINLKDFLFSLRGLFEGFHTLLIKKGPTNVKMLNKNIALAAYAVNERVLLNYMNDFNKNRYTISNIKTIFQIASGYGLNRDCSICNVLFFRFFPFSPNCLCM